MLLGGQYFQIVRIAMLHHQSGTANSSLNELICLSLIRTDKSA